MLNGLGRIHEPTVVSNVGQQLGAFIHRFAGQLTGKSTEISSVVEEGVLLAAAGSETRNAEVTPLCQETVS